MNSINSLFIAIKSSMPSMYLIDIDCRKFVNLESSATQFENLERQLMLKRIYFSSMVERFGQITKTVLAILLHGSASLHDISFCKNQYQLTIWYIKLVSNYFVGRITIIVLWSDSPGRVFYITLN